MYNHISDPILDIYDGETGQYIGKADFDITREVENQLLKLVNSGIPPKSLFIQNIDLYEPADDYFTPIPFRKYKREGTLTANYTDTSSGETMPIAIRFSYEALARSRPYNNRYRSVEFSNIQIHDVYRADFAPSYDQT